MELQEMELKLSTLREIMLEDSLDVLWIATAENLAWLTGARSRVDLTSQWVSFSIIVTNEGCQVVVGNNEVERIMREELSGLPLEVTTFPWYATTADELVKTITQGKRTGSDLEIAGFVSVADKIKQRRGVLGAAEKERYSQLAHDAAGVLADVVAGIYPGLTEREVAGRISHGLITQGITPTVLLVAADERIFSCRHALPTDKKWRALLQLSICAERFGLIVSQTRTISFSTSVPPDVRNKHLAATEIDATLIAHTEAGRRLGDILQKGMDKYAELGFPEEWRAHHLGGLTGYSGRELVVTPDCQEVVRVGQALAWNPTVGGLKSEDTIIVEENGAEVLGQKIRWPYQVIKVAGKEIRRPAILTLGG
ncbi:M24 family metallopeptidase [Moorellaceae bacterium AZ2]